MDIQRCVCVNKSKEGFYGENYYSLLSAFIGLKTLSAFKNVKNKDFPFDISGFRIEREHLTQRRNHWLLNYSKQDFLHLEGNHLLF